MSSLFQKYFTMPLIKQALKRVSTNVFVTMKLSNYRFTYQSGNIYLSKVRRVYVACNE